VATRVVDFSVSFPAPVNRVGPAALTFHNGNFYVGTLNPFPIVQSCSKIRMTPAGQVTEIGTGFTTIVGLAFGPDGHLYVLENTTGANQSPTPGTGRITRIGAGGVRTVIASGLFLPAAMTFGPDGAIYVSNKGFGPRPNGLGQILRITVP
jgi:hypothetical protein